MIELKPLGHIQTPFSEKFGIPRQPGLAPAARATLSLEEPYRQPGVFDGLEGTSHLWLIFLFHAQSEEWQPKVRPPRLGGNEKRGVFATRSPNRPNRLGLSAVKLESVDNQEFRLELSGVDLLDRTPILDIKPYLPYSDCLPQASHSFATETPEPLKVRFSQSVQEHQQMNPRLATLIEQVLSLDPRPRYHQDSRSYGITLQGLNVRFHVDEEGVCVESLGEA